MDIRKWPLDQILQLPDHCFGRRFPVGVAGNPFAQTISYEISDIALPEVCVLWELAFWSWSTDAQLISVVLKLGDQIPANAAQFDALEDFVRAVGVFVTPNYGLVQNGGG